VTDGERAAAFLRASYRRRAEKLESHAWGELVATPSLPRVWDANFAVVDRWDGGASDLWREVDRVQHAHGFQHRKAVLLDEALADRLWDGLAALGLEFHDRSWLMAHMREPDRPADPAIEVLGVGAVDWARGRRAFSELEPDRLDADTMRQLIDLDRRIAASTDTRHLAAFVDGELAAYAALYLDGRVAQIEDVATLAPYRGRGLARAVVLHGVEQARAAGAELVFLVAAEADWPKELYRRLGFDPVGVEHVFGRPGRQHSRA
jgi:ribosomal protein S18 acetylase RimI-like enzyme